LLNVYNSQHNIYDDAALADPYSILGSKIKSPKKPKVWLNDWLQKAALMR